MSRQQVSVNTRGSNSAAFTLFVVFLVLKLTNVIDWSWWWVTAPLWIGLIVGLVMMMFVLAIFVLGAAIQRGRK